MSPAALAARLASAPRGAVPGGSEDLLPGAQSVVGDGGIWGTSGAGVDGYGTILSASLKRTSEREKYPDDNGETIAICFYDGRYEGRFAALVPADFAALTEGDEIEVFGVAILVFEATRSAENKNWTKYEVSGEAYDAMQAVAP